MTRAEIRAEIRARGYSHLDDDDRLNTLIDRACSRLDGLHDWTYLEDSAQGTAPLSIPTLKHVEVVSNETQEYALEEVAYQDLINWNVDLDESGDPQCWYRSTPAGDPVVATWPTNTDTIGCQFWAVPAGLSGDSAEPASPSRFHLLVCDILQQMVERERANFAAASALQGEVDRQVNEMMEELLPQQSQRFTRTTDSSCDW